MYNTKLEIGETTIGLTPAERGFSSVPGNPSSNAGNESKSRVGIMVCYIQAGGSDVPSEESRADVHNVI